MGTARVLADAAQRGSARWNERPIVASQIRQAAEDAIAAARGIRDEERALALVDVAGVLILAGETARATDFAREALVIAHATANPTRRGKMAATIAQKLGWPGLAEVAQQAAEEALATAPAIADPASKGTVLAAAANRMAALGHLAPARQAADASTDLIKNALEEPDACMALLDLAKVYARLGKLWRAQITLMKCHSNAHRMAGYIFILDHLTDSRQGHGR